MVLTSTNPTHKQHTYDDAMRIEMKFEGGKDDDPIDPGGRTNQGVIQREFSAWLRKNGRPNRDVFTMTDDERDAIYWENYGSKIKYDELPPGVDIVLLDGSINSGVSQSVKWAQRALGLTADGIMGAVTLQRIIDHPDSDRLIADILAMREKFLRALKTFYHFGKGWISRITQLKKIGQAWASGSVGPAVVWEGNMNKKATLFDAKPLVSTAPADATAAGGTVATALTTAQQTLAPLQGVSHTVDQVILGLTVLGGLATAFGFAYAFWARSRNAALADALVLDSTAHAANDNAVLPPEVLSQYADPSARGTETGNIAAGNVTTSGRTTGDTETRVNAPVAVPPEKRNVA
jgi:lysozyme family protein